MSTEILEREVAVPGRRGGGQPRIARRQRTATARLSEEPALLTDSIAERVLRGWKKNRGGQRASAEGVLYLWRAATPDKAVELHRGIALTEELLAVLTKVLKLGEVLFAVSQYYRYRVDEIADISSLDPRTDTLMLDQVVKTQMPYLLEHMLWLIRPGCVERVRQIHERRYVWRFVAPNPYMLDPNYQPPHTNLCFPVIEPADVWESMTRKVTEVL